MRRVVPISRRRWRVISVAWSSGPCGRHRIGGARRSLDAPDRTERGMKAPRTLQPEAIALTADLLAMSMAAGLTPYLSIELAVRFGPGPVAQRLDAALAAA